MINIQKKLNELKMNSMMILQVHDELIFEVPHNELSQMESIVSELMPSSLKLDVPLEVEIKKGYDWGNLS